MGPVIGELLPLAIGVAISPVPIIAVILMLFAPHAAGASTGFLLGWVAGIVLVVTVVLLLANTIDVGSIENPSSTVSWVKLVLGVALIVMSVRQWRHRSRPGQQAGDQPHTPKWMTAIDSVTAGRATGLGVLLSAVNPKNLLLCVAAGTAIATGNLSLAQDVLAVAVFTVIAAATVAVPVVGYAVGADRMRGPLERGKSWLETHNAAVMSVLLLVLGAVLLGKGLGGLA